MLRAALVACLTLTTSCTGHTSAGPAHPGGGSGGDAPASPPVTLATMIENQPTHGFRPVALYLDDADHPIGARLIHEHTGFTFDYLRIESAPQGFIWVNSFPTSDKGEPHTQEHLLLGKGNRGRLLGSQEAMSLAESSAFTDQWRTCYHFHTIAGHQVFWPVFEDELDALLNPDYSDEEIRREVRNFGVAVDASGALHLEEKGTVYQEMVRAYEQPMTRAWHAASVLVYGAHHPLAFESGGTPEALRRITADDIRRFHRANYHLANMGMVGAFPGSMALGEVLDHTGAILDKLAGRTGTVTTEAALPAPAGAAPGTIEMVDYPFSDAHNSSPVLLAWPATRHLDETDRILLSLFADSFAGDQSTTLYKTFVDSKTRTLDTGASSVWSYVSTDQGQPVMIGLSGVHTEHLDKKGVEAIRAAVLAQLRALAALPDGDPALTAFNQRVLSRVTNLRRQLTHFLNTPPRFGYRGTGPGWMDHLHQLQKVPGYRKSLTEKAALERVREIASGSHNPWHDRLQAWGLLETPYAVAARPSPALLAAGAHQLDARLAAETARLETHYGTVDAAATLARYKADYDAESARIEQAGKSLPMPPFVSSPPMTLDDQLDATTRKVGGAPELSATFDSMTSARVGVAFRADTVPEADLFYLALLPRLIDSVGIYQDGHAIASDEMSERLRREILDLSVYYSSNLRTGRVELVVEGAGNDLAESKRAIEWMRRVLLAPDWRPENLPRLRDAVAQSFTSLSQRMLGREEAWVQDPRDAWWRQSWPLYSHTQSFLTRTHDALRLRWMLKDPGDPRVREEAAHFIESLAPAGAHGRAALTALAGGLAAPPAHPHGALAHTLRRVRHLSSGARAIARDAGKDLTLLLSDLPDGSLAADWSALCREMAHELRAGSAAALAGLSRVRRALLSSRNARLFVVGSRANQDQLAGDVADLVARLGDAEPARQTYSTRPQVADRLRARLHLPATTRPVYVGLVAPNTQSGVFLNSAPGTSYFDTSDQALLDFLTSNLYTGHGAHSLFMKTWAAGLAYSNGVHRSPALGRVEYYAERCPLLPQTLRFVIGQLEKAEVDPRIAEYAIAGAYASRVADTYDDRARAMAANLTDGVTPEVVRSFRRHLAQLAKRSDLAAVLFGRMRRVYGAVLPGYGPDPATVVGGVYYVIGPDGQLDAYQKYLSTAVGKDARLYRLYPRDYWVMAPLTR